MSFTGTGNFETGASEVCTLTDIGTDCATDPLRCGDRRRRSPVYDVVGTLPGLLEREVNLKRRTAAGVRTFRCGPVLGLGWDYLLKPVKKGCGMWLIP